MAINADMLRGNTDTILLRYLMKKDNYGYAINRNIFEVSGGTYELNEATLYTSFKRLEKQGFIKAYWGDSETGARRKYYKITDEGRQAYYDALQKWEDSKQMLERLIYESDKSLH